MGVNSCGTTLIDGGTFKNIGAVTWDTTAKTSGFTGVAGNGYFVNTTSGAITVTLPSSPSAGDAIGIKDYANTADTNNITIGRNGSKINGDAVNYTISLEGSSVLLVYVDSTKGWLLTNAAQKSDIGKFTIATGGTVTTSGNCKIHTFTSPGTFAVSQVGGCGGGPSNVYWQVVAGGGGGGGKGQEDVGGGGGAGAGGFRTNFPGPGPGGFPISATNYPITVGAGGAGGPDAPGPSGSPTREGSNGSNSVFSTNTSAGGGHGGNSGGAAPGGGNGGSGGGGPSFNPVGSGNTPPVSPPQGNNATANPGTSGGTGGGGFGGASPGSAPTNAGTAGGIGSYVPDAFIGPTAPTYGTPGPESNTRYFAGGGGGGGHNAAGGAGGSGGGGNGANSYGPGGAGDPAPSGTANTGGGGGGLGAAAPGGENGGAGGSGIVMIRYRFQ